jgi:two-component system chemotaxis sensor kinase CheA
MDDLLREFLTETNESLGVVDVELVRFEQDPNNAKILDNIFRLVHTIKGTCGFLGLPRLEALAHAAETLMGKFRDGMPVSCDAVSLILSTIDRVKDILDTLDRLGAEPNGTDEDLIDGLQRMVDIASDAAPYAPVAADNAPRNYPFRHREVSLDELERAFREAPGPDQKRALAASAAGARSQKAAPQKAATPQSENAAAQPQQSGEADDRNDAKLGRHSIRVNVNTLEQLMTMVSELVLTRNQLLEIVRGREDSEFKVPLQRLSNVTAELQESVMKTRMQPVGNAWQKLPRVVRDLANDLGKQIELEMHGADTELDRQVLDFIKDPLTHMVRNSADHGLETTAERRAAGKPEKGTIRLSAYHEGGHIVIQIADDGRGLDTRAIKSKVIAAGLATEEALEKLSEAQIHKFIFAPGFSTASTVTAVSGRGVGLDVVKTNIDQISGTIDLKSTPGQGTVFYIKIPLTLAIVSALIVESCGERFAIPQLSVVELVHARSNSEYRIERIKGAAVLRLRNKLLPLVDLKKVLGIEPDAVEAESGFIVVSQVGNEMFGIVVDSVFHTEEIVVKPMSGMLRHIAEFSGNTILGDGSVIMILDPNGIAKAVGSIVRNGEDIDSDTGIHTTEDEKVPMLIFRAGSMQPKAVPLSLVTRLEEVDATKIEHANGRHLIQYRGQLMPLIAVNASVVVKESGPQSLLVFADDGRAMGLIVDEIVDIVEERLVIEVPSDAPGILGSAIVKGKATDILDLGHFLPLAFEDWLRVKSRGGSRRIHNVLLVDDSPFFRGMLTPVLRAAGYAVTAVASAREALEQMRLRGSFDIILTDIEMPEMNGFDFTREIRANPQTAELPVIALSSMVSAEALARGRDVGFHDYVAKFDRPGLIAALKEQTESLSEAA